MTERRDDFGVLAIKEPYFAIPETPEYADRPDLHPNYDFDKPNKGVFQYHEPTKDLEPPHTPDKDHFPEKWRFYDFDLDAIREQVGKDIAFARGLQPEVYKQKEDFHDLLVEHNRRQEKRPAVG